MIKNNKTPLISVLMPAYNASKYIGKSIESILNQSYKNLELIIIDDASADETWKIINMYTKKDKRIKSYKNNKNLYIAGTRNKLIKLARGEYIAWQDADDISMPKRLEHQYKFLKDHQEVGIVGGFLEFFNNKNNRRRGIRRYFLDDENLRKRIFRYSPVAQPTAMIRKRIFDEVGDYNLKYPPAEDLDMSFRIGKKYKFANLQEITLKYRENEDSATFKKLKKIEKDSIEIRKKYSREKLYKMSEIDKIYIFFQSISVYLIPSKLKIKLFNLLRNTYK